MLIVLTVFSTPRISCFHPLATKNFSPALCFSSKCTLKSSFYRTRYFLTVVHLLYFVTLQLCSIEQKKSEDASSQAHRRSDENRRLFHLLVCGCSRCLKTVAIIDFRQRNKFLQEQIQELRLLGVLNRFLVK